MYSLKCINRKGEKAFNIFSVKHPHWEVSKKKKKKWSFRSTNATNNCLARLIEEKESKEHIKILKTIKRLSLQILQTFKTIKDYYKQVCDFKFEHLDEMNIFRENTSELT